MQPVASVGDRDLADGGAYPGLVRRREDGVSASGASAPEDRATRGLDVVAAPQVRDGVAPVRELPSRRKGAAVALDSPKPR